MKAIGSAFPGDDFLNSIMDLSNFSDLQVWINFLMVYMNYFRDWQYDQM
jgi:hypothetical protein